MADFLELASRRQSCREFADRPVEHEKLVKCVEAARLAPSGCNSQPWTVVVVEDPAKAAVVAAATEQLGVNKYIANVKAFFVVCEEQATLMPKIAPLMDSQVFAKGDLGGFVLSLCLEAESQGLGTCILGMFDRAKIKEALGIPAHGRIFLVVAAGYAKSERVREKQRKPIEAIVRYV
jgi:nitroreductase